MQKPQKHIFLCTNTRPPFAKQSCGNCKSNELIASLREMITQAGATDRVKVTASECLGPCEEGPVMVVYPEGVWHGQLDADKLGKIVQEDILEHLNQPEN